MSEMAPIGRMLMITGLVLVVIGALAAFGARIPRIPGDIVLRRDAVTIYIPIVSSIVLSIVLTVLLGVLARR